MTYGGVVAATPPLTGPTIGSSGGQTLLTWYTPTLSSGVTGTIVLTVTVLPGTSGTITNTVTITSTTPDPTPEEQ